MSVAGSGVAFILSVSSVISLSFCAVMLLTFSLLLRDTQSHL